MTFNYNPSSSSSTEYKNLRFEYRVVENTNHGKEIDNHYLSNWDSHIYASLFRTIQLMTELPETDPYFLESEVSKRTQGVLSFLRENVDIAPPKIINQDNQAISLTWTNPNFKRYITVYDDEICLLDLPNDNSLRKEEVISIGDEYPFKRMMECMSILPRSSSL